MDEPKVKGKKGDPRVILVGPSDAGKTTIFTKVRHNYIVHLRTWYMLTPRRCSLSLSILHLSARLQRIPSYAYFPQTQHVRPSSTG